MVTEKRLIDANKLELEVLNHPKPYRKDFYRMLKAMPTADAVEVSRLGELGRLMMPYEGCPRGRIGARGDNGTGLHLMELDAIVDIDGNRWIPVLADDLAGLKARQDAVEVVRCKDCRFSDIFKCGRWCDNHEHYTGDDDFCSDGERRVGS